MDQLDKKLYNDLNMQIEIPEELDVIIKSGLNKNKKSYSLNKIIAIACSVLIITSGIVYAGGKIVYENIWKEPQKVTGENAHNNDNQSVPKQNTMSEDEARKKGQEILEKFGYGNDRIKTLKLEGNPENYDLTWCIETEQNISIDFDANGEAIFSIYNNNILNETKNNYKITKEDAENTAKEIVKNLGYDSEKYNYIQVNSDSNIWNVSFYKEYEGIKNPYERIYISFIPQINKICSFIIIDKKFEDNPIMITEEEAKEIALKEEQKNTMKYDIKDIEIKLKIEKMNGFAYLRTNDYKQSHEQTASSNYLYENSVFYRTESQVRRIWLVTIVYNIPDRFAADFNINDERVSYFIDVTTGEVIGGGSIF